MGRNIQFLNRLTERISLSRNQSYRLPYLLCKKMFFPLKIGDYFFLNFNSGKNSCILYTTGTHDLKEKGWKLPLSFREHKTKLLYCIFFWGYYSCIYVLSHENKRTIHLHPNHRGHKTKQLHSSHRGRRTKKLHLRILKTTGLNSYILSQKGHRIISWTSLWRNTQLHPKVK